MARHHTAWKSPNWDLNPALCHLSTNSLLAVRSHTPINLGAQQKRQMAPFSTLIARL